MTTATIDMISPTGTPITLAIAPDSDTEEIIAVLDRADKIGAYFTGKGWVFATAAPAMPSLAEISSGPTFAGFPCSPTIDANGLPTWIMADGKQAMRREKQGDVWYSVKLPDGNFDRVLTIPKGEQIPPINGGAALATR